jgi:hypothetical protein
MPCPFGLQPLRQTVTLVIRGEGLGQRYHRGVLQKSTLLGDHPSRLLKLSLSIFRRTKDETFWALEDVLSSGL